MSAAVLTAAHLELLARVDLFSRLDRVALARLAVCVEPQVVPDGQAVCRQGQPGDSLFVVARGAFGIFVGEPDGQASVRVGAFGPGEYFGEMALLTDEPRSATVTAKGEGEVLRLERSRFLALLQSDAAMAIAIAATLSRRVRDRDRLRLQGARATAQVVEQALRRLPADRRRRVLQAAILEQVDPAALRALYGDEADEVAEDLVALGIATAEEETPSALLESLRAVLEQEDGPGAAGAFARDAAARLLAVRCWGPALRLLRRWGPRATFVAALAQVLHDAEPMAEAEALRWAGDLAADEIAADPALAALHRRQLAGQPAAAGAIEVPVTPAEYADDAGASRPARRRLTLRFGGLERIARAYRAAAGPAPESGAPAGAAAESADFSGHWWRGRADRVVAVLLAAALVIAAGVQVASRAGETGSGRAVPLLLLASAALTSRGVLPSGLAGLGLIAALVAFGIATPAAAAAGFASAEWVFVLAVLGIAAGVSRSGLLFRAGLLFVRRLPGSLAWQAGALLATGVLLSPLLPQETGRAALTAPLALAVAEARRLPERGPAAAVLGLAAWVGSGPLLFLFLNASPLCLLAWGLLPPTSQVRFDWLRWLVAAAPLGVLLALGAVVALLVTFRPPPHRTARDRVDVPLAVLGPLSGREWAMVALLVGTLGGWTAAAALRLDVAVVAVLGLLAATLVGNFDPRSLRDLDWDFLLFFGVALSLTRPGAAGSFSQEIAASLGDALAGAGVTPLVFVVAVAGLHLLARLALAQDQALLLLGLTLVPLAPRLGVEPWVVVLTLLATSTSWFLSGQTAAFQVVVAASEGRLFTVAQGRLFAIVYTALTLAGLALCVPYWRWLGLL